MQGDNGDTKEVLGIPLLIDYLAMSLIYHYIILFCPYNKMALYNITIVFKIFALLTCISRMLIINRLKYNVTLDTF